MRAKLFETALDEAIRYGAQARLVITFPGNEDALHMHPLAYEKIDEGGFRVEIRVSKYDDEEVVDDIIFLDATAVETVELQVKQRGAVWRDEPYRSMEDDESDPEP